MSMYARITTGTRSRICDGYGGCKKLILGKEQEVFFRVSIRGCGVNYCSACLRKFAAEIDKLNDAKKQAHESAN